MHLPIWALGVLQFVQNGSNSFTKHSHLPFLHSSVTSGMISSLSMSGVDRPFPMLSRLVSCPRQSTWQTSSRATGNKWEFNCSLLQQLCKIVKINYWDSSSLKVQRFVTREEHLFSWDHYFQFSSSIENVSPEMIEERTRNAIRGVIFCDVTASKVFPDLDRVVADVMIASLVLDVVALTDAKFKECLTNIIRHIKYPGGFLILQGSLGENTYNVGASAFPVMDIDEQRLLQIFKDCHLTIIQFEKQVKVSTHYFALLQVI